MTQIFPKLLWWVTTVMFFAAFIALLIDGVTFLTGHPDQTFSNTFQRFFGGSTASWRSGFFGYIVGTLQTHLTRWGAIPAQDRPKLHKFLLRSPK